MNNRGSVWSWRLLVVVALLILVALLAWAIGRLRAGPEVPVEPVPATDTPTASPTVTRTSIVASNVQGIVTDTPAPTWTATARPTATDTPAPSPTSTRTSTATPSPTDRPTATDRPAPTDTPVILAPEALPTTGGSHWAGLAILGFFLGLALVSLATVWLLVRRDD